MRTTTRRFAKLTIYGGTAVAAGALTLACSLQADRQTFATPAASRLLASARTPMVRAVPSAEPTRSTATLTAQRMAARVGEARSATQPQQGNPAPRYPAMLRMAEVEGIVTVQFATDAQGVPDMQTLRVISSTHDLFTNAVRDVLPSWHLAPNVAVQMPFVFVMANKTGAHPFEVPANAAVVTGAPAESSTQPALVGGVSVRPTPVTSDQTYFEFQVEREASPMPGNGNARYPDALREAKIEGDVLAQFVVDTTGAALMDTFKALKSTDSLFTNAVRSALPNMRFYPAQVGGHPVKQLIQMPFTFRLAK